MRYLGLDVGRKKIGVAIGTALAEEFTTLRAPKDKIFYEDEAQAKSYKEIAEIAVQEKIDQIIVGLPVDEIQSMTPEAEQIKTYALGLERQSGLKVIFVNETLTSFMAEDMLVSQRMKRKQINERIDQLSAKIILQQYLDSHESI